MPEIQSMLYRQLFVSFVRDEGSGEVFVAVDRNFIDKIYITTNDKKEFAVLCNRYLDSDRYKKALEKLHKKGA